MGVSFGVEEEGVVWANVVSGRRVVFQPVVNWEKALWRGNVRVFVAERVPRFF